jgi:uncharacterized lipoprotein YmbA
MTWRRGLCLGSLHALMMACTSAPLHFHTLIPAPPEMNGAPSPTRDTVEVESVRIPAQVDRLELVVRRNNGEMALAEGDLWIAPLADELRNAVSVQIDHQLRLTGAAHADRKPSSMSVRVNVERFESAPGRYALIEAMWQLQLKGTAPPQPEWTCRTYAYERAGAGVAGLVRAHQRAVASLAEEITLAAQRLVAGISSVCAMQ